MKRLIELLNAIKPEVNFEETSELVDAGILDSIELFEIIVAIEDTFSIRLDPEQIDPDNFQSIDSMWNMIMEKTKIENLGE